MSSFPYKFLGLILMAGSLPALADEAGKAAAKAYARGEGKAAIAKEAPAKEAGGTKASRSQDAAPGPGRMQVEEPGSNSPDRDANASKAWQKTHSKGLTDEQKTAFRERKEKMEGMIALIKAKRKALQDAKPEERAALARELHSLILEKDPDASSSMAAAASVRGDDKGAAADGAEARKTDAQKENDAQAQRREEIRARQLERYKQRKGKDDDD